MPKSSSGSKDRDFYHSSVLKIFAEQETYNERYPWQGPQVSISTGSGFILSYNEKNYIVTNAHVVGGANYIKVKLASESRRFSARITVIDNQCDLAILSVEDDEFWAQTTAFYLGDIVDIQNKIKVVGFPIGGEEICITKGIVNRQEVGRYCYSGEEFLQTQVSAEINPGNSGGPAIYKGKVVGVVFQGIPHRDGIGYIIPIPILKHFLHGSGSGYYQGFPNLNFTYQYIDSPYVREHYGLDDNSGGIRIRTIDRLSSCFGLLRPDDILLSIDTLKVGCDGILDSPKCKRYKFTHYLHTKNIGDVVVFEVLRARSRLNIHVQLTNTSHATKKLAKEWGKPPTFYIHSGVVFVPLNYFNSNQTFFTKYQFKDKKEPGDEKIIIHTIISSDLTRDLDKIFENKIISTLNGQKIRNLRQLIGLLESSCEKYHTIVTKDKFVFLFKNIDKKEQDEILKKNRISADRSNDLLTPPYYSPGCPEYRMITSAYDQMKNSKKIEVHHLSFTDSSNQNEEGKKKNKLYV